MIISHKKLVCKKCGYKWIPRKVDVRLCAWCKNAYWENPATDRPYTGKRWQDKQV